MDKDDITAFFEFFSEVGIIEQLNRTSLDANLPPGLMHTHFGVVSHLSRVEDGQTPKQIASAFQVAKTSLTHTLAGLEKHDLVEMRPNPDDSRSKRVWLTDAGREFRAKAMKSLMADMAELSNLVSAEELRTITPVMTRVRKFLDDKRSR